MTARILQRLQQNNVLALSLTGMTTFRFVGFTKHLYADCIGETVPDRPLAEFVTQRIFNQQ